MLDGIGELPTGWEVVRLGTFSGGKQLTVNPAGKPDVEFILYSVPAHATGKPECCKGRAIGSNKISVTPGTVLLCKINPRINRVWVVADPGEAGRDLIASTEWITFPPHTALVPEYLRFFLMREPVRAYLAASASGVGGSLMRSNAGVAGAIELRLAPLAEQQRIAAAIQACFTELDEAEAALARAQAGLTEYRASLLHVACTGQLTAAWRASRPQPVEDGPALLRRILAERRAVWERAELARLRARGKPAPCGEAWKARYPEPVKPNIEGLPALPDSWTWATVDQLGMVSGGITKNNSRTNADLALPYLRVANVGENNLRLSDVSVIGVNRSELDRLILEAGDVLFVEGNGSPDHIGRVAIWDGSISPCVHQNHLIKCRPVLPMLSTLLLAWFMSPAGRERVRNVAASTSGLYTLSISKISALPVPLPSAAELNAVENLLPENMGEGQQAECRLDDVSGPLADLRQSILHAAFTGRLVPQNPADESAVTLLARLRASSATPRRTRKQDHAA